MQSMSGAQADHAPDGGDEVQYSFAATTTDGSTAGREAYDRTDLPSSSSCDRTVVTPISASTKQTYALSHLAAMGLDCAVQHADSSSTCSTAVQALVATLQVADESSAKGEAAAKAISAVETDNSTTPGASSSAPSLQAISGRVDHGLDGGSSGEPMTCVLGWILHPHLVQDSSNLLNNDSSSVWPTS